MSCSSVPAECSPSKPLQISSGPRWGSPVCTAGGWRSWRQWSSRSLKSVLSITETRTWCCRTERTRELICTCGSVRLRRIWHYNRLCVHTSETSSFNSNVLLNSHNALLQIRTLGFPYIVTFSYVLCVSVLPSNSPGFIYAPFIIIFWVIMSYSWYLFICLLLDCIVCDMM